VGGVVLEGAFVFLGFAGVLGLHVSWIWGLKESAVIVDLTWSAVLPVMLPMADWTAPVAVSRYDWRVEVSLSDMIAWS
jgi:hypothetical protein